MSGTIPDPIQYAGTRRVWIDNGDVYVEDENGATVRLISEEAITLGRLLSEAGAKSYVDKIIGRSASI